jgi:hypothetical protein
MPAATNHSVPSGICQREHGRKAHSEHMTVAIHLLTAVGTAAAVVILLLMAATPLLIDLPLHPEGSAARRPVNG